MIYECVINVSQGQNLKLVNDIAVSAGDSLLDIHVDRDHNRSVFTLASKQLSEVYDGAKNVVQSCFETLDIRDHFGVHPRMGVVDVVPFVSFGENFCAPTEELIVGSQDFGKEIYERFGVPIFFYDYASSTNQTLPSIRKSSFDTITPDIGGSHLHSKLGALCVGAREPLVAININLDCTDLDLAKTIARQIRQSNGGIKGVRAIGLLLANQNKVQVSINIVDTKTVNIGEVCLGVSETAKSKGFDSEVELVGLIPEYAFKQLSKEFVASSGLDNSCTVERRLYSLKRKAPRLRSL